MFTSSFQKALRSKSKLRVFAPASGGYFGGKIGCCYTTTISSCKLVTEHPKHRVNCGRLFRSNDTIIFPVKPLPFVVGRLLSTSAHEPSEHFLDEHQNDLLLHERELQMHRHSLGPVSKMTKLSSKALRGKEMKTGIKILDLDSQPADSAFKLAEEYPEISVHCLSISEENAKTMAKKATESKLLNISTGHSTSNNLEQFPDASLDLVISCYGLQKHSHPKTIMDEVHR